MFVNFTKVGLCFVLLRLVDMMAHPEQCFFQEGNYTSNLALTDWYSRKLQNIDKNDYENHLTCRDCLGNTLILAAVYAEK